MTTPSIPTFESDEEARAWDGYSALVADAMLLERRKRMAKAVPCGKSVWRPHVMGGIHDPCVLPRNHPGECKP